MKKLLSLLSVSMIALLGLAGCSDSKDLPKVGVVQYVEHTSLNQINDSMIDELEKLGYVDGENIDIDYKNGQGEGNTINSIVSAFEGDEKDVVVAIATPAAQVAAKLAKKTPVVFSAVSDPIGAGLVSNLKKPDKNITGTSDEVQVEQIIDLMIKMYPNAKTIGFLYNKSEANSVSNINRAKKYAEKKGLKIQEATVASTNEVQQATQVLASKSDFILTPNDNTVAKAMSIVTEVMYATKVPVFVGADSMVMDGGLATIGINYDELGRETARMIDRILKGEDTKKIPVKVFKNNLFVYINEKAVKELNITLPEDIKSDKMTKLIS